MPKPRQTLSKRFKQYLPASEPVAARIGRADGTIFVAGKTNEIYVTEVKSGQCVTVLNLRIANDFGKLVVIGYDPIIYPLRKQILSLWDVYPEAGNPGTPAHSEQHTFPAADTVWIKPEQTLPSLVQPSAGELQVTIYPNTYKTLTGWKSYPEVVTLDFSASVPGSGARITILVADKDANLIFRDGDVVADRRIIVDENYPALEPGDNAIYALYCYAGQTEAAQTDLVDLRYANITANSLGIVLDTTPFDNLLSSADDTPQKAFETLDEHTHVGLLPATSALNDFVTGDGSGNWVKKTLAQTITILRTSLDSIYAAATHNQAASTITSGTLDGDRLPALSATKKGGAPATGTPSGKYLKDDGTWDTPAGGSGLPASTATNDMLVGNGSTFIVTAIASFVTMLRGYIDSVYAAASHNHAASAITSGSLNGDLLPALSTTKRGGVAATGTPAGKFFRDDDTWQTVTAVNVQHGQATFTIEGVVNSTGVKPIRIYLPYVGAGATFEEVYLSVGTAPAGGNLRINVKKNGTSIFNTTQYAEITSGNNTVSKTTDFASPGTTAKDDYLTIEVVLGNSTASDLTVHVRYKWTLTGV